MFLKLPSIVNRPQVGLWVGFWCGRAKLNVVFLCRLAGWQNTSFNFAEALAFFLFVCLFVVLLKFRITTCLAEYLPFVNFLQHYFKYSNMLLKIYLKIFTPSYFINVFVFCRTGPLYKAVLKNYPFINNLRVILI